MSEPRRSAQKLISPEQAREVVDRWRGAGEAVAIVSEAFDLLDVATLSRLASARSESRHVIAAVWSDARARAVLGVGRPLLGAADRALLAAALRTVDLVVVLDDPFPDWLRETPGVVVRLFEPEARAGSEVLGGGAGDGLADVVSRVRERLARS